MKPRAPHPESRPCGPAAVVVALAAAVLAAVPAAAVPPHHRAPVITRVDSSVFPTANPGYLPLVGPPALRFAERSDSPAGFAPPPVVLYAPRPPKPEGETGEKPAEPPPVSSSQLPATAVEPTPRQVRPEDVLPYFQLGDGSGRGVAENLQFTPAIPSRAEYRQQ